MMLRTTYAKRPEGDYCDHHRGKPSPIRWAGLAVLVLIPAALKAPFCKVRRTFRPEDFNYREPWTVKAVNAWAEAIRKRKKWMSFEDWADEYEWKHRPD